MVAQRANAVWPDEEEQAEAGDPGQSEVKP